MISWLMLMLILGGGVCVSPSLVPFQARVGMLKDGLTDFKTTFRTSSRLDG